jgi:DNA-binding NtrC family response regulator
MSNILKIMIIDDDEDILNLFHDFLTKEGYNVATFLEPLKALKEIESNPLLYSLIITDIRMPGISGIELVKKVSSINDDLKVILMSAFEINGDDLKELTYNEHLQKPVHMSALVSTIRQILGES